MAAGSLTSILHSQPMRLLLVGGGTDFGGGPDFGGRADFCRSAGFRRTADLSAQNQSQRNRGIQRECTGSSVRRNLVMHEYVGQDVPPNERMILIAAIGTATPF